MARETDKAQSQPADTSRLSSHPGLERLRQKFEDRSRQKESAKPANAPLAQKENHPAGEQKDRWKDTWKIHAFWLCVAVFFWYSDHSHRESTRKAVTKVREQVDFVRSSAEDLEKSLKRFESEEWRQVLPEIKEAAEEINLFAEEAASKVGDLEELTSPDPEQ